MDSEKLKNLYFQMLLIRRVEEKIVALYPEQEMRCPVHLSIGQEAVAAGVCEALQKDDYVLSGHRAHAHYLAKGGNLKAMIAEIYLRATGCCQGKGGSMHLNDREVGFLGAVPIVGSSIPIAVGTALKSKMCDENRVTVVFLGEAATEEGVFAESLNFAVLKNLPVVFLCENNLYSVYSPLSVRQPENRKIYEWVRAYGMDSDHGDGNNVIEVAEKASKAIEKARQGQGPTFLEFETYRWREHCGPNYDNDLGYRTEDEFLTWKERDPIARYKDILIQNNILQDGDTEKMCQLIDQDIEAAFTFAQKSPFPDETHFTDRIYAQ